MLAGIITFALVAWPFLNILSTQVTIPSGQAILPVIAVSPQPTRTQVLASEIELTPTETPTPSPSPTPIPTATPTPSPIPPSPTPIPTDPPKPSRTPSPLPPTPTNSPTPLPTPVATVATAGGPALSLDDLFTKYADMYQVNREQMRRIAVCESGLNPKATNPAGYVGLFQFAAQSWSLVRNQMELNPDPALRTDPEEAIKTAAYKIAHGGAGIWGCN